MTPLIGPMPETPSFPTPWYISHENLQFGVWSVMAANGNQVAEFHHAELAQTVMDLVNAQYAPLVHLSEEDEASPPLRTFRDRDGHIWKETYPGTVHYTHMANSNSMPLVDAVRVWGLKEVTPEDEASEDEASEDEAPTRPRIFRDRDTVRTGKRWYEVEHGLFWYASTLQSAQVEYSSRSKYQVGSSLEFIKAFDVEEVTP